MFYIDRYIFFTKRIIMYIIYIRELLQMKFKKELSAKIGQDKTKSGETRRRE